METRELRLPDYTYKAELIRVIDGDTIDVEIDLGFYTKIRKRLRLLDVDTEELRDKDPTRKQIAIEAKIFVETMLTTCKNIYIQTEMDATGKYGRLLANVWFEYPEGMFYNLNKELLKMGLCKEKKIEE